MRVLLISANTEQINMPVLPIGLAHVAAAVELAGHEVRLLNPMSREGCLPLIGKALDEFQPEAIGISVRNIDNQQMQAPKFLLDPVKEMVARCRKGSTAPVILGGAGFSIFPQSALDLLGADMGIRGEGEDAFVRLLAALHRPADVAGIPGIVLPGGNSRPPCRHAGTLDAFPYPSPGERLAFPHTFEGQEIWLPFQTRRGCPMECSYCSTASIEGKVLRRWSPGVAADAVARFRDAGFSHFFFVDNTFNLPASYAAAFCDELAARGPGIRWRCILYPWKLERELAGKMARSGCAEVSFGFESGSDEILRRMNKRFRTGDIRSAAETLHEHDIWRMGFLLLGGPGETRDTVLESLSFADSLGLESMKVTVGIRIYPGTALADTAGARGMIAPGQDLLFPTFYIERELDGWLQETVQNWAKDRPNWIL
ncbi:MAG: radical SAM protein [Syntrophobacteraceae bacterium]